MSSNSRQLAFKALYSIFHNQAYTDIALQNIFSSNAPISPVDRHLISELVYGVVRRKRTLNSLINQLGTKKASQQPLKLRIVLQLGLYQLRYLDKIPPSAAVNTSVDLAKRNGMAKISGVVNGILRSYLRKSETGECLVLPDDPIPRLGVEYSFPNWIVTLFQEQFGKHKTKNLLQWFNQTPRPDLRVNNLKISTSELQEQLLLQGIETEIINNGDIPPGLKVVKSAGNLASLPLFQEGLFTIQDASAQLVTQILDPQPEETIVDACAAPGGKTTHIAELMKDKGEVIAIDCYASRLKKIQQNIDRLQLKSIKIQEGDSSQLELPAEFADRVLVDVPCSGLGTMHKNPDIRWQKKPDQIAKLSALQLKILTNSAKWVKTGGTLVYATCTLNPAENEDIVEQFLKSNPHWQLDIKSNTPSPDFSITSKGTLKIFPPKDDMDGFFIAKLVRISQS